MRTTALLSLTTALLALAGCSSGGGRTLTAHVEGGAGRTLYFDHFQANKPVHADSVKLDANGNGALPLPDGLPLDFYALSLGGQDLLVLVLDSMDRPEITVKADSMGFPKGITGSPQTEVLHGFFQETRTFEQERQALVEHLSTARTDTAALGRLNKLNASFYERNKTFAREHKSSPVALSAMRNLNIQQELPLFAEVRDALRKAIPRSEYFVGFSDQVDRAQQQLAALKAQEEQIARLNDLIPIGSPAPEFKQTTPDGRMVGIGDLKGKVVLIDFWASWCRPCRMEMPNVKKVYAKYHDKGFEILGVSLDREKDAWTDAIAQDGLPWMHVSDLQFWNNAAAQQYGVSSIPYTVLVGRDGNVLAKDLRGPQLEQKLAEVLK